MAPTYGLDWARQGFSDGPRGFHALGEGKAAFIQPQERGWLARGTPAAALAWHVSESPLNHITCTGGLKTLQHVGVQDIPGMWLKKSTCLGLPGSQSWL